MKNRKWNENEKHYLYAERFGDSDFDYCYPHPLYIIIPFQFIYILFILFTNYYLSLSE